MFQLCVQRFSGTPLTQAAINATTGGGTLKTPMTGDTCVWTGTDTERQAVGLPSAPQAVEWVNFDTENFADTWATSAAGRSLMIESLVTGSSQNAASTKSLLVVNRWTAWTGATPQANCLDCPPKRADPQGGDYLPLWSLPLGHAPMRLPVQTQVLTFVDFAALSAWRASAEGVAFLAQTLYSVRVPT